MNSARRVAVLQSNYIPWKGYFDIIHDVDLFVFYDDVQYTKNDWRNRNRIKSRAGADWITIPAGSDGHRLICEVELPSDAWQAKHWRTLTQNYCRAPHFARYAPYFEDLYLGRRWSNLSHLNQTLVREISHEFLGISTEFADSRSFALAGRKQDRLLDLVVACGADIYVSGPAAQAYIDPARFAAEGVDLVWKDYGGYPEYPQRHPPFEHGVSVLDLLFNVGPQAPWYIWGWRTGAAGIIPAR
jgi:WbqC-like protein family